MSFFANCREFEISGGEFRELEPTPTADVYARLLLPRKHGFPLFHPAPCDDLPEPARRTGTQIGDVGVVTDDGSFDPIFNILYPADDLANRFGVPADFEQVILPPHDIRIRRLQHPPGTVLSNTAVGKKRLGLQASVGTNPIIRPWEEAREAKASTNSKQTATVTLSLPDGASISDLACQEAFRDYAMKHAKQWYAFVNDDLQRIIGHGSLYLITGVTKSTSWRITTVENFLEKGEVSLKEAVPISAADASWESESASSTFNYGPHPQSGEETWQDNQTIFLRGFKVALRPPLGLGPACPRFEDTSNGEEWQEDCGPNMFHPLDIINQYILDSVPDAVVAVTHDDEWTSVLNESDDEFPEDNELIKRISNKFDINSSSGGACLRAREELRLQHLPGTVLSNTAVGKKSQMLTPRRNVWPPPPPASESDAERAARIEAEHEAKRVSNAIDESLALEREQRKRPSNAKILLLGQAESGKSTILKNFQLHFAPKAFQAEAEAWRPVIHLNLVRSVNFVLGLLEIRHPSTYSHDQQPTSSDSPLSGHLRRLSLSLAPLRQVEESLSNRIAGSRPPEDISEADRYDPAKASEISLRSGSGWTAFLRFRRGSTSTDRNDKAEEMQTRRILSACAADIMTLWAAPEVQQGLRDREITLQEQSGYFLDEVERICRDDYVPTSDDILRARVHTIGPEEHIINMESTTENVRSWTIYDMGGSTSQQLIWAQFFDSVHVIIFLVPVSAFNETLAENHSVNHLFTTSTGRTLAARTMTASCATMTAPAGFGVVSFISQDGDEMDQLGFIYAKQ